MRLDTFQFFLAARDLIGPNDWVVMYRVCFGVRRNHKVGAKHVDFVEVLLLDRRRLRQIRSPRLRAATLAITAEMMTRTGGRRRDVVPIRIARVVAMEMIPAMTISHLPLRAVPTLREETVVAPGGAVAVRDILLHSVTAMLLLPRTSHFNHSPPL